MDFPKLPYYHIDSLISQGGTAAVYRGVDLRSGYLVAIKALFPSRAANSYILKHFREEACNYLYLSHPNLTKLIDFVEYGGRFFLVMEYIDGTPLDLYINTRTGPLSDEFINRMFLQLLDTVAYLHQNGKLHLDIKPNNIMVLQDGKIKLLDMGISVKMGDRDIRSAGTPPFMPPEQIRSEHLGIYTDIFALGVTLFNLVTGRLPFHGSPTEIFDMNCSDYRPKIRDLRPDANPGYQRLIEKAMCPDKNMRYKTCEEMMADLINLKEGYADISKKDERHGTPLYRMP